MIQYKQSISYFAGDIMDNDFETILESSAELRKRLLVVMMENPESLFKTGRKIGISEGTLSRFIRTLKPISIVTALRIKKFLEDRKGGDDK
jgi:hypothetical protein